jgi:hypothetical protein
VGFDFIITRQVKCLAHALNVTVRKKRANIRLITRGFRHCASQELSFGLIPLTSRESKTYCFLMSRQVAQAFVPVVSWVPGAHPRISMVGHLNLSSSLPLAAIPTRAFVAADRVRSAAALRH